MMEIKRNAVHGSVTGATVWSNLDFPGQWHEESGLPYSHISRICACSV